MQGIKTNIALSSSFIAFYSSSTAKGKYYDRLGCLTVFGQIKQIK